MVERVAAAAGVLQRFPSISVCSSRAKFILDRLSLPNSPRQDTA